WSCCARLPMTIPTFSAKTIPVRWSSAVARRGGCRVGQTPGLRGTPSSRCSVEGSSGCTTELPGQGAGRGRGRPPHKVRRCPSVLLLFAAIVLHAATPSPLGVLVHAYRESPTAARRAAIQTYIAGHPKDASLANLALGVAAYEQKNYADAIALLVPIPGQLPKIADYAGYYLAASRIESSDFASVPGDLAAARRNSPLNGQAWVLEARARQSSDPAGAAKLLIDHYAEISQPEGDVVLGDSYRAANNTAHAAEAYQRVYTQY